MIYFTVIGGVLLVQAAISYGVILAGTGNGSFVGLGAMLFAVVGLPITAIANFVFIRLHRKQRATPYVLRVFVFSSILPVLQLALLVAVSVFRL